MKHQGNKFWKESVIEAKSPKINQMVTTAKLYIGPGLGPNWATLLELKKAVSTGKKTGALSKWSDNELQEILEAMEPKKEKKK